MPDLDDLSAAWNRFVRARWLLFSEAPPSVTTVPDSACRSFMLMAGALPRFVRSESERLSGLLGCSDNCLTPLGDPLRLRFGTHRWLDLEREREETYSDWLAWLLEGSNSTRAVIQVFGLADDPFGRKVEASGIVEISREEAFRTATGERKKCDLIVRFTNGGVLLVEIKVRALEEAGGSENLPLYYEQLTKEQPEPDLRRAVLLIPKPADFSFDGWELRSWDQLSLAVRRLALSYCQLGSQELLRAAMLLSFAGAVEENILRLGRGYFSAPQTAAYIERFLAKARS